MRLNEILYISLKVLDPEIIVPVGIIFGSRNFSRTIGAVRTNVEFGTELLYARQKIILIGKSYNLHVIDMNYNGLGTDPMKTSLLVLIVSFFEDLNELSSQAEVGARMGFSGKVCSAIRPEQYKIIQEIFLPDEATKQWALGLLVAYKRHLNIGQVNFQHRATYKLLRYRAFEIPIPSSSAPLSEIPLPHLP